MKSAGNQLAKRASLTGAIQGLAAGRTARLDLR